MRKIRIQSGARLNHLCAIEPRFESMYMLSRVFAIRTKLYPNMRFCLTSHEIAFEHASHEHLSKEILIHELTCDLQRLQLYAEKRFITFQKTFVQKITFR